MGNIVITISWLPTTYNFIIQDKLKTLAIQNGLNINTDSHYIAYKPGYTQFGADISGLYLAFDRQYQYNKVVDYGQQCRNIFKSMDIEDYDIHIDDLPL